MSGDVLALSGGVGGAKLARGLARVLPAGALTVVCNSGDDFQHLGLQICPDLDSVTYGIAGLADAQRGWGRAGETWQFMESLRALGGPDWFNLGDRDLALHVWRTQRLQEGLSLSAFTAEVCQRFGIAQRILPMTDAPVRTLLETDQGTLEFQDYFVRRRAAPRVIALRYVGADDAGLPGDLAVRIRAGWSPACVVVCPSNPYLSIDPILAIPAWRDWLSGLSCPIVAVSPIVGGQALKGCAGKMLQEFGHDVSALSVARHYAGLIEGLVIDDRDHALLPDIETLALSVRCAPTVMRDDATRDALARDVLQFAATLRA
jgi:LPPG:FO 2-phospho-L-lactate transferase